MTAPTPGRVPKAPERKITAAASGGTATAVVLWLLEAFVFGGGVPSIVVALVPVVVAAASGWLAKHTNRTDPAAKAGPVLTAKGHA